MTKYVELIQAGDDQWSFINTDQTNMFQSRFHSIFITLILALETSEQT